MARIPPQAVHTAVASFVPRLVRSISEGRAYLFGVCGSSKCRTTTEWLDDVVGWTPDAVQAETTETSARQASARRKTVGRMAISYARLTAT